MLESSEHISRVTAVVSNPTRFSEFECPEWKHWRPGVSSWTRCLTEHGLDPSSRYNPDSLSQPELRRRKELMGGVLPHLRDELDQLFLAIRNSGYSVSLADHTGLVILERSDYNSETYFPPDRPGTKWSEQEGGTNGIGTALVERRPVAVYHSDHFFSDLIQVACIGMPIFGADEQLLGAVNLSIRNQRLAENTHRLIYDVAQVAVRRLEERFFYDRYKETSVLRLPGSGGEMGLIALSPEDQILGMNRVARDNLALAHGAEGSLWDHFERGKALLPGDAPFTLRRLSSGQTMQGRLTAPDRNAVHMVQAPAPASRREAPLSARAAVPPGLDECAGEDARMHANVRLLRKLRGASLPILLLGETGVGKDTLARAIHNEGDRPHGPFIPFNCAAVPEALIDSELFGYGVGAFTGARKDGQAGRVQAADGGTLFLDEIGDMPLALQTRLLRVLETGEVTPLGNAKTHYVDVRVVAATNQALEARVAAGLFRQDLYHRLAGVVLNLPPLRDRADLDALARAILARMTGGRFCLSPEAQQALQTYGWPGNVRELRHVLHRASLLAESHIIMPEDLLLPPPASTPAQSLAPALEKTVTPISKETRMDGVIVRAEREALEQAMLTHGGEIDLAARTLGVSRATLYRKLRAHGIKTPRALSQE